MRYFENKRLERLLRKYLIWKAREINPPSSDMLWAELEQQLKHKGTQAPTQRQAEEIVETPTASRGKHQSPVQTFWKRYRPAAVVTAAGLVLVIIISQLPFTQVVDYLAPETIMRSDEGAVGLEMEMEQEDTALQETVPAQDQPREPTPESSVATETKDEQDPPGRELLGHTELNFTAAEDFREGLEKLKPPAAEEVYLLIPFTDDFTFATGTIIHTEEYLVQLAQTYENSAGEKVVLTQQFIDEEIAASTFIAEDEEPWAEESRPVEVGAYEGHIAQHQDGRKILVWKQDNSLLILTGELEKDALLDTAENSLVTFN